MTDRAGENKLPLLPPGTRILDIRWPETKAGKIPFAMIQETFQILQPDQGLAIRVNFEPDLLRRLLKAKGYKDFEDQTIKLSEDDWLAVFLPCSGAQ